MPKITPDTVQRKSGAAGQSPCGPYEALFFSDSGGLTQFGALVETLPPGSRSALAHWHEAEDEMVYILEGRATVTEGDETYTLSPGEAATFKAGVPAAHCLANDSTLPLRYLVIGARAQADRITYPLQDRVLHLSRSPDGQTRDRRFVTSDGQPAHSPYVLGSDES